MGLPSDDQVIELLADEFSRAGVDIENVAVNPDTEPARVTVVVDADSPVDLDSLATLSRTALALLDERYADGPAYELEVTTPGVDRPLTKPSHFRRAHGRLAQLRLVSGEELVGRIGVLEDEGVHVVLRKPVKGTGWVVRDIPLADIAEAVVQVEFSPPNRQEMDLAGVVESGGGA